MFKSFDVNFRGIFDNVFTWIFAFQKSNEDKSKVPVKCGLKHIIASFITVLYITVQLVLPYSHFITKVIFIKPLFNCIKCYITIFFIF